MKLEDLKKELETQATEDLKAMEKKLFNLEKEVEYRVKECLTLREKNAELYRQVNRLPPITIIPDNEKLADVIYVLSNRCKGYTNGALCGFCNVQEYCRVETVQKLRLLLDLIGMPGPQNL